MMDKGSIRTDSASIDTFITAMRAFFDEAVNDSCFNAKWKQIESYLDTMENCDSIRNILNELQGKNQHIFNAALFNGDDEARTNERKAMEALVVGKGIRGRDPKTGTVRLVCAEDVVKFINEE
eukprot:TRINITY_DN14661_c0_g1_i2.p2 TRINITY_DN14661_c0_g1~~TRINITY_DN14661_c0_g1_i2.p2  ORF type:complete len:123 (+),score=24.24 TRINITY_DN14661_c0_g1_i2:885-1253(+)